MESGLQNLLKETCVWFCDKTHENCAWRKNRLCKECGKICQTEKRLVIHENVHKENHISNQQFHCEECPYRTIVKEYLVNHVRLIHKTDRSRMFLCTLGSWQVRQQAKILSQPWETWKTQNYTCGCILWWLWQEIFGKKKFKKTH